MIKKIKIGGFEVKNDNKLFLIAGPCVIENRNHALYHAKMIKQICDELSLDFVFKSSRYSIFLILHPLLKEKHLNSQLLKIYEIKGVLLITF